MAAELARHPAVEGEPAEAGLQVPAKATRSSGTTFARAAAAREHDANTTVGAADARHDFRVWDLYDGPDAA